MKKIILSLLVIGFAFASQAFEVVEKSGWMMDKLSTYHVKFKYTPLSKDAVTPIASPVQAVFYTGNPNKGDGQNPNDNCSLSFDVVLGEVTIQMFLPADLEKPTGEATVPLLAQFSHAYDSTKDDCVPMLQRPTTSMPSVSNSVSVKYKNLKGVESEASFMLQGNTPAVVLAGTNNNTQLSVPFNFRSVSYWCPEAATKVFGVRTAQEYLIEQQKNDSLQQINDSLRLANPDYEFIKD